MVGGVGEGAVGGAVLVGEEEVAAGRVGGGWGEGTEAEERLLGWFGCVEEGHVVALWPVSILFSLRSVCWYRLQRAATEPV